MLNEKALQWLEVSTRRQSYRIDSRLERRSRKEFHHDVLESLIGGGGHVIAAFEHHQSRPGDHFRQRFRISDCIVLSADDYQDWQPHRSELCRIERRPLR